jgi:hypothetical protein
MKHRILIFLLACSVMLACKKDEKFLYDVEIDNIYLDYQDEEQLTYSFAYTPGLPKDTIWVPVKISGKRVSRERKFQIQATDTGTTAKPDVHYEALKPFYVMPADSGMVRVPIILLNAPGLDSQSVKLTFQVVGGEDFDNKLPKKTRTKSLLFSNRLEIPSWWMLWVGELGPYSRVKHQLFLISSGTRDLLPQSEFMEIPRSLFYISNTRSLLKFPFSWVDTHPELGYVLTERTDGSGDYDLYQKDAPASKFHLKYFSAADTYIFLDENGNQITM